MNKLEHTGNHAMQPFEQFGKIDPELLECMPDFLVIAPPRCGTTWLFENLLRHPEIFVPAMKEVKYFSNYWNMCDINWYLSCFKEGVGRIKGEVSPSYAILPEKMIAAVKGIALNLRIIIIFRDPIERSWSHAKHQFRFKESVFTSFNEIYENVPESKIIDCLTNTWMMAYSDYLSILRRWASIFPKENIYVNFFDSIISTPQSLLENIFQHIGVSKDIDWLKLPLHERFFQGIEQEVPVKIKNILLSLYHARMKEFANYLLDVFGLKIPERWNYIIDTDIKNKELYKLYFSNDNTQVILNDVLMRESMQTTHIQLLKEDYKDYKIIAFKGDCLAISKVLDGIDIVHTSKADLEKYKRERKILCSETLNEALTLIDTILSDRDSKVEALQGEIAEKDIAIQRQRNEIEDKQASIVKLQAKISDRDAGIESLQRKVSEGDESIRKLNEDLQSRDRNTEVLQKAVTDRDSRIEALQGETAARDSDIQKQRNEIEERQVRIGALQADLADKDLKIEALQFKLDERDSKMEILRGEIINRDTKIEAFQREVVEKGSDIERQRKEIEEKEAGIVNLQTEVSDRDSRIKALQGEITQESYKNTELQALLKENGEKLSIAQQELSEKDRKVEALRGEITHIKALRWFRLYKFFRKSGS